MKVVLYGAVLALVSVAGAQSGQVAGLRTFCARLDQEASKMQAKSQNVYGRSAEGGEVTGWFRGKNLQKGRWVFYGEGGRAEQIVWLRAGVPVSRQKKMQIYDKQLSGRVIKTNEERFYFAGGRTIARFINGKKTAISPSQSQKAFADARREVAFLGDSLKAKR